MGNRNQTMQMSFFKLKIIEHFYNIGCMYFHIIPIMLLFMCEMKCAETNPSTKNSGAKC